MNTLSPLATLFVLTIGLILPILAWRSGRRLTAAPAAADAGSSPAGPTLSRRTYYVSAFVTQATTLGFALLVAREVGMPLFGPVRVEPLAWLATLAVFAGLLATLPMRWRTRAPAQRRRHAELAPRTPLQALANIALCLTAGVGEEITYRGVLHGCLWWLTGSWWIATVACSLSFGVAHAIQGRRSMLIIAGVAFWMHVTVLWTGSLHLAMFVHAAYDLIATFTIAKSVARDEASEALAVAPAARTQDRG
ncbi:MAG TPA: CPBP family intramembrane glutamic endopeptidase [Candidatus Limnocylindrales bacterium]|nr:CPBP family intramembrane glutamic endopeptidase [Candidatus Limnocylindrales bacterium]